MSEPYNKIKLKNKLCLQEENIPKKKFLALRLAYEKELEQILNDMQIVQKTG